MAINENVDKLGVVGSRSIKDVDIVREALAECPWWGSPIGNTDFTFVSGGADGVDTSVEYIADGMKYHVDVEIHEPDYSDWSGEHPAKQRNTVIVEESEAIVAVWDGMSNGTRDTIDKALDRGVPIYVKVVD